MNDNGNRYGFSSNVDTHMMKNSEWAVVAYLSQSKYGKLGNTNFSGENKEIYQNKSDSYITGCSLGQPGKGTAGDSEDKNGCQYTYDIDINGTGASTTGTVYGIYDMSGGTWEYVMGNYNDEVGESGFTKMPEQKYYDKYTNSDSSLACNGGLCLSHGLSETTLWYWDAFKFLSSTNLWLMRGALYYDGTSAGVFEVGLSVGSYGDYSSEITFRLVIAK